MSAHLLINLIDNIKNRGFESVFGKYYSFYQAEVLDNKDPEKKGRIKVKVPQITGSSELANLAWPKDFRLAGKNSGEFFPPDVGDMVYVEFEGGDLRFPVYSGGYFAKDELADDFIHDNGKPKVRGFRTKYGHKVLYDETQGKEKLVVETPNHKVVLDETKDKESVFVIHKTGAQLNINQDGSVNIYSKNGANVSLNAKDGKLNFLNETGALISISEGITISESQGKTLVTIDKDGIQLISDKKFVAQTSNATIKSGAITLDATPTQIQMGNGKLKLQGLPGAEVIDLLIQILDALINAPVVTATGVGPSGPFFPDIIAKLTVVKTFLTSIKS